MNFGSIVSRFGHLVIVCRAKELGLLCFGVLTWKTLLLVGMDLGGRNHRKAIQAEN